jgi:4-aminobutyrate aminotransferase-like enzyme
VPEKRYLLTPGPTPVPPEVLAAAAEPVIHHRGPDFKRIYGRCIDRLRAVALTRHDVLLFTTPGTGALESAVANVLSPGDRAVVVSAGYFGERWAELVRAYGADLVEVRYAWGETPERDDLRSALAGSTIVGEVRGRGFLLGVELVNPRDGVSPLPAELQAAELVDDVALAHGVLVTSSQASRDGFTGDQTLLAPAYTSTDAELAEMIDRFASALRDVQARVEARLG